MKTVILLSLVFSFFLIGCSSKENTKIVFEDRYLCIEQKKIQRVKNAQIRVHNDDVNIAVAHKVAMDSAFEYYENQVDRNNKFCEEVMK